jgi:hypothetical protein
MLSRSFTGCELLFNHWTCLLLHSPHFVNEPQPFCYASIICMDCSFTEQVPYRWMATFNMLARDFLDCWYPLRLPGKTCYDEKIAVQKDEID